MNTNCSHPTSIYEPYGTCGYECLQTIERRCSFCYDLLEEIDIASIKKDTKKLKRLFNMIKESE